MKNENLYKRLWNNTPSEWRKPFYVILVLMVVTSFAEIFSIGLVIPFLGALTNPLTINAEFFGKFGLDFFSQISNNQGILILTILFGCAALLANFLRLLLLWSITNFSNSIGASVSSSIYRRTLYQPFEIQVNLNSSNVINGILNKTDSIVSLINSVLVIMSSGIILFGFLIIIVLIQPIAAITTLLVFSSIFLLINIITKNLQYRSGVIISSESIKLMKLLQEGLGGIRDIIIDGTQELHHTLFRSHDKVYRNAISRSIFISQSPRYGLEALAMLTIAGSALILTKDDNGIINSIPLLGSLVLGVQRLLPLFQQIYSSFSNINVQKASVLEAILLLEQPLPNELFKVNSTPIIFKNEICLNRLGFRYNIDTPWIFQNLELKIKKGSRNGVIGQSGSGKSTLLDIIMGLLTPVEGCLIIDGTLITRENVHMWQENIAHVPQVIFLSDSTIEENIAFGVEKSKIDYDLVKHVAKQAQLSETIEKLEKKYKTNVGQGGIRLSGGQRQRIGIARALYKKANVIIFDEATSALDNETEQAVMQSIESLSEDLTIIIIAHRLSTLKNCSQIIELANNRIKRVGNYQDIIMEIDE